MILYQTIIWRMGLIQYMMEFCDMTAGATLDMKELFGLNWQDG